MQEHHPRAPVSIGQELYNEAGQEVGTVIARSQSQCIVQTRDGAGKHDSPTVRSSRPIGEVELIWRCGDCGAVGAVGSFPERCPLCSAPPEHIHYVIDD